MSNRILIIEDEAIIAEDIQSILQDLGYDVPKVIYRSDKAIDYLSFNTPDLVLCDINIKGNKDGIEVAEIVNRKKRIPFVYLTSLSDKDTIRRASLTLPYGYIVKPFNERDLHSAIEIALSKFQKELEQMVVSKEVLEEIAGMSLTSKELNVILDMIKGVTYDEMKDKYDVSKNTIKFHSKNIFLKFDVANKTELLRILLVHFTHL